MDAATLAQANVSARRYLLRANTYVALGDSLIEQAGGAPVAAGHRSYGFITWLNFFLGQRLRMLRNAGVGGERSDQILARVASGVLAYNPGYVVGVAGTNDIAQGIALSTIKANLTSIWNLLDAAGIRIVWCTIPPRNTYTGTQLADLLALNAWIRAQGRSRRNLRVADLFTVVVSTSVANYQSAYTPDGIHLGNKSAPLVGRLVADVLEQVIGPIKPQSLDLGATEGDTSNVQTQARFTAGSVGSNTTPTGWTQAALVGGPVVYSRVERTDGVPGQWLRLAVPTGTSLVLRNNNSLLSAGRFAIGDTLQGSIELRRTLADAAPSAGTLGIQLGLIAVGPNATVTDCEWASGQDNQSNMDLYGVMQTDPLVVPASPATATTQMQLQLTISGGQTIDVDRATIRNITRNG